MGSEMCIRDRIYALGDDFTIETGGGDDRIEITSDVESAVNNPNNFNNGFFAENRFTIRAGSGEDRIELTASNENDPGFFVEDFFVVDGGIGDDRIELLARNDGQSSVGFFAQDILRIEGGGGDDRITLGGDHRSENGASFVGQLHDILAGTGDDRVSVSERQEGAFDHDDITFDGGSGNDRLDNDINNADIFNFEDI